MSGHPSPPFPPPDTAAARSVVRVRVRFCETDLMGIVHHGSYPAYLEVARVEWLRRRGVAYGNWASRGLHLAVAELNVRYRTPARFDDEIDVEATLGLLRAASVRFDYRLMRVADGALVAEASTMLACVNQAGALTRMSPEVAGVLRRPEGDAASWIAPAT
jgi:acyl-CoA thioester hydrolase